MLRRSRHFFNSSAAASASTSEELVKYSVNAEKRIATLTLNRPRQMNAIIDGTGTQLAACVARANADDKVHCIVLQGAGRAFCSGYDLEEYASKPGPNAGSQHPSIYDPFPDFQVMSQFTHNFMSLHRSLKPTICKIHGAAIGGGSDIALCCDMIVSSKSCKIGYPPAKVWGVPTTMRWASRVGVQQAKRLLLTGEIIDGKEAERIGLVLKAVDDDDEGQLDREVSELAGRVAELPKNQLFMNKIVLNQFEENTGMNHMQTLATVFDGLARNSPEGVAFKQDCEKRGWRAVISDRDRKE